MLSNIVLQFDLCYGVVHHGGKVRCPQLVQAVSIWARATAGPVLHALEAGASASDTAAERDMDLLTRSSHSEDALLGRVAEVMSSEQAWALGIKWSSKGFRCGRSRWLG